MTTTDPKAWLAEAVRHRDSYAHEMRFEDEEPYYDQQVVDVDAPAAYAALQAVLDVHMPRTEQVVTGDCADEMCGHENKCPTTPTTVCSECNRILEDAHYEVGEGLVPIVEYPCPTVRTITDHLPKESDRG